MGSNGISIIFVLAGVAIGLIVVVLLALGSRHGEQQSRERAMKAEIERLERQAKYPAEIQRYERQVHEWYRNGGKEKPPTPPIPVPPRAQTVLHDDW